MAQFNILISKIFTIGNINKGKRCLMKKYHEEFEAQLGIDFIYKAIQVNNYQIKLQI